MSSVYAQLGHTNRWLLKVYICYVLTVTRLGILPTETCTYVHQKTCIMMNSSTIYNC